MTDAIFAPRRLTVDRAVGPAETLSFWSRIVLVLVLVAGVLGVRTAHAAVVVGRGAPVIDARQIQVRWNAQTLPALLTEADRKVAAVQDTPTPVRLRTAADDFEPLLNTVARIPVEVEFPEGGIYVNVKLRF